jgi:hypothetical protein
MFRIKIKFTINGVWNQDFVNDDIEKEKFIGNLIRTFANEITG